MSNSKKKEKRKKNLKDWRYQSLTSHEVHAALALGSLLLEVPLPALTTQCNEKIRGCVTKSLLSNSSKKRREAASESKMSAWDTGVRSKARDASNVRVLHLIKLKQEITGFCNPASANGSNKIVEIEKTRIVIDKMSIDYDWKMTGDPRWMVEAAKFLRATTWHDSKSKRVSCVCLWV